MIEFKKNVKSVLPYNRDQYLDFLFPDSVLRWYGISFQFSDEKNRNNLNIFIEVYKNLFKDVVTTLDKGLFWVVNHEDKDMKWFPNDANTLASLRNLFKQKNIPNTYKGAIMFTENDLLEYSADLISYPHSVFGKENHYYKDLNISHERLPFIIKISGHLNIDFRSTDKELLKNIIDRNGSDIFCIKQYRGTDL